jgi:hypothetical protein
MRRSDVVAFISIEDEEPDLVVSFALEPHGSRSITLLRTPPYEELLPDDECGVAVMSGNQQAAEREILESITITSTEVVIESTARTYRLQAMKLSASDRTEIVSMLRRMNFDCRFVINAA